MSAPPLPRELQVEVTGACNLRCTMCLVRYRPAVSRAEGAMSFEMFRRLVDGLPDLETLTLQGLGEPLLAPDLERMVEYAAARGARVGFNTNGTLLTRERGERLAAAGLAWLHVSVDGARAETHEAIRGGVSLARVRENVVAVADALRGRDGGPRLRLVCVAMRRNVEEIPDLVRLASEWGVLDLWVQNLSHDFEDAGADYAAIREFAAREALWEGDPAAERAFAAAREAAGALGVELRLPRLGERPPPRAAGEPGCDWPWRSAYVTHRGAVQPCCMVMGADRATLGRVDEQPFEEVWGGPATATFASA